MYCAKKKKTEKIKHFWHKHHHGRNTTDSTGSSDARATPTRSRSTTPPTSVKNNSDLDGGFYSDYNHHYNPDIRHNNPPNNEEFNFNSNFSADYERYMRTRKMNMQRIHELQATKMPAITRKSNPNGISAIEQDILNLVDLDSPSPFAYSSSAPSLPSSMPQPASSVASTSSLYSSTPAYIYDYANTQVQFPNVDNQKYLTAPPTTASSRALSPRLELERFRSSYVAPSPFDTTYAPTTTTSWSSQSSSSSSSSQSSLHEYPSYFEHKHEGSSHTKRKLSAEYSGVPWGQSSASNSEAQESDFAFKDYSAISELDAKTASERRDRLDGSQASSESSESNHTYPEPPVLTVTPPAAFDSRESPGSSQTASPAEPVGDLATVSSHDGTVALQEDLENLLLNIEEHFKRRPSGIPKAPPPSPDDYANPGPLDEAAVFADFDFTQPEPGSNSRALLSPRPNNHAYSNQQAQRSLLRQVQQSQLSTAALQSPPQSTRSQSSASSSESSSPYQSAPSSPIQFYLSPPQPDMEPTTPPTSSPTSHSFRIPTITPPTAPPVSTLAPTNASLTPAFGVPAHVLDCQGNFPSPPPPPAFNEHDLTTLRSPLIPPPDFDYSAFDFQGNRIDRPPNENENEEPALHTTSFTTTTTRDPEATTVSATVTSTTTTPTAALSTVSTATTTTSTSAIPTTPTTSRTPTTTSIATVSTVTKAVDNETGRVANATVTTTTITHPHTPHSPSSPSPPSSPARTSTTVEYEESVLPQICRVSLLDEIRRGKTLRRTPTETLPAPRLPSPDPAAAALQRSEASSVLASVLASRRAHISAEDSESEPEIDDDDREEGWM